MADLGELLARVEGASGPDRELDFSIGKALCGIPDNAEWQPMEGFEGMPERLPVYLNGKWETPEYRSAVVDWSERLDAFIRSPEYRSNPEKWSQENKWPGTAENPGSGYVTEFTASIDAALALVERVLGKHWLWEIKEGIGFRCILWTLETDWDDRAVPTGHSAHSAPYAILAALLRALAESGPVDTTHAHAENQK